MTVENDKSRLLALADLLECPPNLDDIEKRLKTFAWDYDETPLILSRFHVRNVLERYSKQLLSAEAVERWANLIECREDIEFENSDSDLLGEVIYELANPRITRPLTLERATALLADERMLMNDDD